MPNHITNKILFTGLTPDTKARLLEKLLNAEGKVDFAVLLPMPLNIWQGSVSQKHEQAFKAGNGLDWARVNWGTKWGAYDQKPVEQTEDSVTLVFDTAWSPPRGWLVAIFNLFEISFEYHWLDEGESHGHSGHFKIDPDNKWDIYDWDEVPCSDEMQKHLHLLKWGVEEFPPEEDEETADAPAAT